jgi:hypothetical protein
MVLLHFRPLDKGDVSSELQRILRQEMVGYLRFPFNVSTCGAHKHTCAPLYCSSRSSNRTWTVKWKWRWRHASRHIRSPSLVPT